jgi:hypothetical protein
MTGRPPPGPAGPSGGSEAAGAADRLRQALVAVADGVNPRPDAYQRALAEWRRRERRRRLAGVVLACLVVAGADTVGVWALNRGTRTPPVVFDAPPPAVAPASSPASSPAVAPAPSPASSPASSTGRLP